MLPDTTLKWDIGRNEIGAQADQPDGVPPSTLLKSRVSADLGNHDGVHVAQNDRPGNGPDVARAAPLCRQVGEVSGMCRAPDSSIIPSALSTDAFLLRELCKILV
jgi:hypothetical protein